MLLCIRLFACLLILAVYSNFEAHVFASSHTLVSEEELKSLQFTGYESINPNLLIFPVKRIVENFNLKLKRNKNDKVKYQFLLFDIRFKELVFIINFQKTGFLEETVERYNSFIGDTILNNKEVWLLQKNQISTYIIILKSLQDRYNSESAYRLLIQQAIDSTRRII